MRSLKFTFIFLVCLLVFLSCEKNDISPGDLEVSSHDKVLKIHNRFESEIYYFVVERNTAALINWVPRVGKNSPFVESGKTVEVNFESILGYKDDAEEAIVYYWIAIHQKGSLVPGNVHSIIVNL
ncbi:hypothetical protein QQ008_26040 [Fulvivirgaceae bacterium BMA10]|uniref:Uncharacterized protein n=1 Tax=Splendidivirga corallicola TaxID=3051826 RepID=A0ABT8KVS9_9BACT|nr:hypothetical protein [Fulvivirgaceae bacterium BMA10]